MMIQCLTKTYEQAICCIIDTQWCTRAALSDALYLNKKQFDKILLIVEMGTLAFGNVIPLLWLTRDFQPLDNTLAKRTRESAVWS